MFSAVVSRVDDFDESRHGLRRNGSFNRHRRSNFLSPPMQRRTDRQLIEVVNGDTLIHNMPSQAVICVEMGSLHTRRKPADEAGQPAPLNAKSRVNSDGALSGIRLRAVPVEQADAEPLNLAGTGQCRGSATATLPLARTQSTTCAVLTQHCQVRCKPVQAQLQAVWHAVGASAATALSVASVPVKAARSGPVAEPTANACIVLNVKQLARVTATFATTKRPHKSMWKKLSLRFRRKPSIRRQAQDVSKRRSGSWPHVSTYERADRERSKSLSSDTELPACVALSSSALPAAIEATDRQQMPVTEERNAHEDSEDRNDDMSVASNECLLERAAEQVAAEAEDSHSQPTEDKDSDSVPIQNQPEYDALDRPPSQASSVSGDCNPLEPTPQPPSPELAMADVKAADRGLRAFSQEPAVLPDIIAHPESPEGMDCYASDREFLADFEKYFNNDYLSDVTLIVGDEVPLWFARPPVSHKPQLCDCHLDNHRPCHRRRARTRRRRAQAPRVGVRLGKTWTGRGDWLVNADASWLPVEHTFIAAQWFNAHRLMLVKHSEVFERMLSEQWSGNKKEIELVEEANCVKVFPAFLRFLYCNHVVLHSDNTLPLLILADKYNVTTLRNVCLEYAVAFILPQVSLKDLFHIWFQYGTKCFHPVLTRDCIRVLAQCFDELITNTDEWGRDWCELDRDQMIEFLKCNELNVENEFKLWKALELWLQAPNHPERRGNTSAPLLANLLPLIRFPFMTSDELNSLENSPIVQANMKMFQQPIMNAYKYQALPLSSKAGIKEFMGTQFLLRTYTELRWDKRLVVTEIDSILKYSEMPIKFCTRACAVQPQHWEWELKVHPKGFSSSCEEFKVFLSSNVILDQTRPVEYLLQIVDDKKIIRSICGKKTFTKTRYCLDLEVEKKVGLEELLSENSPLLVGDSNLCLQLFLKPID